MGKDMQYQHLYSIGIIPGLTGMVAIVYNWEDETLKEYEGDFFQAIEWVNKNADLSKSIAMVQNVDLITEKFNTWNKLLEKLTPFLRYIKWKSGPKKNRRLPDKYDYPDLQSDFFVYLNEYGNYAKRKTVEQIITQAFKIKGVKVIGCDATPVRDKVKERIELNRRIPGSYPGGANDNINLMSNET